MASETLSVVRAVNVNQLSAYIDYRPIPWIIVIDELACACETESLLDGR